jgi:hypothetical protein
MCSFSNQCSDSIAYNMQFPYPMIIISSKIVQFFATMFSSLECEVSVPYNAQYICNPLLQICFFNLLWISNTLLHGNTVFRETRMMIKNLMHWICSKSVTTIRKKWLHAYYTVGYCKASLHHVFEISIFSSTSWSYCFCFLARIKWKTTYLLW